MAAASATKASQRSRAPFVNLFDLPELMPGAQPSANPAQREEFENRCRQLHRDEEQERQDRLEKAYEQRAAAAPDLTSTSELEAMFPTLDAELVRSIHAEAQTPQDAVDTLLALTLAAEPLEALPTLPPREVGMDDHDKFPALTDAEGWQVANQKLFDRDPEEDLGSAWRDRAKAAQDMPAPKAAVAPAKPRSGPAKAKKEGATDEKVEDEEVDEFLTDYDFRHRVGQQRAKHRARYGRGSGRGAASARNPSGDVEEDEEEEASQD
eukprot:CAMPEP_0181446466 /NCGR_PEP_ID=MMETSP1110-20121109/26120_1 /TAXON_ID=174948 /ORGANISM="Symbiodinium sp., Strain CCMP421" /LENGTH=265 /DNA_ID=CAMNT_0023570547 /DNA_START=77 /DNA_END=874 /DNA_ORIENTATION=+